MNENLFTRILSRHFSEANKTFIETVDGVRVTYRDLDAASARYANALIALGAGPGSRVVVQVPKSIEAVFAYMGAIRAGVIFVPLNTAYKAGELDYFFTDAAPKIIVCAPDAEAQIGALAGAANAHVVTLDAEGRGSLREAADGASDAFDTAHCGHDDIACILYTSGTTGRSKGAMITHGNLVSNALALIDTWGMSENDVLLHALPIYHVHGLFVACNTILGCGGRLIWFPSFKPQEIIAAMPDATMMMGVPTFYSRLLSEPNFDRLCAANMRLFIAGSAPLLPQTFEAFEQRTGHRVLERYGMTETGMSTSNPLDGERRPGSIGFPLPGVQARVADESGRVLGAGETGVLEVLGPNVFAGYWNMPEKTAEEFRDDGFFITGDIASISDDGYITISGRAKDMIISGGLNVYPKEIEEVIDGLPGVSESAVFGTPHPDFGEGVLAAVVLNGDADGVDETRVIEHTRAQLAAFKVPKKVFLVEALPRNTMGKVQKAALREQYAKTFGDTEP